MRRSPRPRTVPQAEGSGLHAPRPRAPAGWGAGEGRGRGCVQGRPARPRPRPAGSLPLAPRLSITFVFPPLPSRKLGCAVPTSASSLGLEELPLEPERRKEAKYQQPSRRLGRSAASPPPAAAAAPARTRGSGPCGAAQAAWTRRLRCSPPELRLRAAEDTAGRAEAPGAVTTPFPSGLVSRDARRPL